MPKPNKDYFERVRELKDSYLSRGYLIVGNKQKTHRSESKSSVELIPQLPVSTRVQHTPVGRTNSSQSLKKLKTVYKTIEDNALFLSPVLDLKFPGGKEINLDEAGTQKIQIGEEAYNSVLLYTILTSVIDDGKMLVCGPPGSGKTSSSRFVGSAIYNLLVDYIKNSTIYGHPEQTEEKMVAMYDPIEMIKGKRKLIIREFLKSPIKVIDEINRLRPESLSILYELLNSGTVTYQNQLIKAVPGPLFATANASDSGNYDIPPPVMDRFKVAVVVDRINPYYVEAFSKKRANGVSNLENRVTLSKPITRQDIAEIRRGIYSVDFPSDVMGRVAHFISELTGCDMAGVAIERKTKGNLSEKKPPALCKDCDHYSQDKSICSNTENGLSARAIESIFAYSKAVAYWRGKKQVGEEDIRAVIPYATWFRLTPTRAAFENEPRFINDRISLVEHLYDVSSQSYDEIVNAMPEYSKITSLVFSSMKNGSLSASKNEIEDLISVAGKLDTPAKYPLVTALKKIYNDRAC